MRVLIQDGKTVLNSDFINKVSIRKDKTDGNTKYNVIAKMIDEEVLLGTYLNEKRCMSVLSEYFKADKDYVFPPVDHTDSDTALKKIKEMPIEKVEGCVTSHTYNCIMRISRMDLNYLRMNTLGDLLEAKNRDLVRVRNLGEKTLAEINDFQRIVKRTPIWWLSNIDFPERYKTEKGQEEVIKEMEGQL